MFRKMDTSGYGKLTKDELKKCLKTMNNIEKNDEEIDLIFSKIDTDKNGYITYSEFLAAMMKEKSITNEENIKMAFNFFDAVNNKQNQDGQISAEELALVFKDNFSNSKEKIDEMMKKFDTNNDKQISYEEFHELIVSMFKE